MEAKEFNLKRYVQVESGKEYASIKSKIKDSDGYATLCTHMNMDTFNKYMQFIRTNDEDVNGKSKDWAYIVVANLIEEMQAKCALYGKNKHYYIKKLFNVIEEIIKQYNDDDINVFVSEVPDMLYTLFTCNFYEIKARSERFIVERDGHLVMFKTTHGRTILTIDQDNWVAILGEYKEIGFCFYWLMNRY